MEPETPVSLTRHERRTGPTSRKGSEIGGRSPAEWDKAPPWTPRITELHCGPHVGMVEWEQSGSCPTHRSQGGEQAFLLERGTHVALSAAPDRRTGLFLTGPPRRTFSRL